MAAFFERILQVSLSGSVIVLAVLVLRMLLRNAPRRTMCLLWLLAVLRLLVPFEIQSQWSLQPKNVEFAPRRCRRTILIPSRSMARFRRSFWRMRWNIPLTRLRPR